MNAEEHIALFDQTGELRHLEAAIAAYRKLLVPNPDPLLLLDLGNALSRRYTELRREEDIREAIGLQRRAVAALAGRPYLAQAQAQLAAVLGNHPTHAAGNLAEALELYAAALRGQLQDRPMVLANYGMSLQLTYLTTGDRAHLASAAEALRESVTGTDPASDTYLWRLAKLGSALIPLAGDPERAAELKEIVGIVRDRYDKAPPVLKREIQLLLNIALTTDLEAVPAQAWEQFGNPDLSKQSQQLIDGFSGAEGRARYLAATGSQLIEEVRRSGRLDRADQAVEMLRQAMVGIPPGSPEIGTLYGALGAALGLRMEFSGTVGDMDEMIAAVRRAVALSRPDDENRGMYRSDLGNALWLRFRLDGGDPAVLDEAIDCYRRALADSPEHPQRAMAHTSLGAALFSRFELTGYRSDLDQCVDSHRAASSLTAPEHPNYALYLANLGSALHQRFTVTGQGGDAVDAAEALRDAVSAIEQTSPYRPMYLASLGALLTDRYRFTGQTEALEEGIGHLREASRTAQPGSIQRPMILNNLGLALTQNDPGGDEAIEPLRAARDAAPPGSHIRAVATLNLGGALVARGSAVGASCPGEPWDNFTVPPEELSFLLAQGTGRPYPRRLLPGFISRAVPGAGRWRRPAVRMPDLDEGVALLEEASRTPSVGRAAYARLGLALQLRYRLTGNPRALTRALRTMRAAVAGAASGDPGSSMARFWLADLLVGQWELTKNPAARDEAIAWFRRAAEVETASADWRATVGQRWGEFAMGEGLAVEAADGFAMAIGALDEAAWRGLGRDDQERVLGDYEGLARDAAAAAIRAGDPNWRLSCSSRAGA